MIVLVGLRLIDIAMSSQINASNGVDPKLLIAISIARRCQTVSPNPFQGRAGFAIFSITGASYAHTGPIQSGNPV